MIFLLKNSKKLLFLNNRYKFYYKNKKLIKTPFNSKYYRRNRLRDVDFIFF